MRDDRDAGLAPSDRPLDPTDTSVQVHACHGATRQVEVLREVLVGLMADDPTLEPRDVLVMCPDLAPPRSAAIAKTAAGLRRLGVKENVFTRFSSTP